MKRWIFVFLLTLCTSLAWPQIPTEQRDLLVRLERQKEPNDSSCIIVYVDGGFHSEHEHGNRTDVWESQFDSAQLEQVSGIVSTPEFRAIDHPHASSSLRIREYDLVSVDVGRGNDQQQIRFRDRDSRKPFDRELDPLLRWFADMQRAAAGRNTAAAANRCLPATQTDMSVLETKSPNDLKQPGESHITKLWFNMPDLYMRLIHRSYGSPYDRGECLIVHEGGAFYYETQKRTYDKKDEEVAAASGQLTNDELKGLTAELARPELANSTIVDPAIAHGSREYDGYSLLVKREGYYQQLSFRVRTGVSGPRYGDMNITAMTGHDGKKEIGKLREWIKQNVEPRPMTALTATTGQCW
jgi:hypothetical protein